jgi:adenylate cyclase
LFTDGTIHVATSTTKHPAGFTLKQFADLESIITPLARVAEIRALRRTAANLIDTYVGHQTGERILAGKIRRGYVEGSAPRFGFRTRADLSRFPSKRRRRP